LFDLSNEIFQYFYYNYKDIKLEEVTGFTYNKGRNGLSRDLSGFEDGTVKFKNNKLEKSKSYKRKRTLFIKKR
jgi:hypothetical protein